MRYAEDVGGIPSHNAQAEAGRSLALAIFLLLLQTGVIVVLVIDESTQRAGQASNIQAFYPVFLAIVAVVAALYAWAKEKQETHLTATLLEMTTLYTSRVSADVPGRLPSPGALSAPAVAPAVLAAFLEMVGARRGSIFLMDMSTGVITRVGSVGGGGADFRGEEETAREVAITGAAVLKSETSLEHGRRQEDLRVTSALWVPLRGNRGIHGAISAYTIREDERHFASHEVSMAEILARHAALILEQTPGQWSQAAQHASLVREHAAGSSAA